MGLILIWCGAFRLVGFVGWYFALIAVVWVNMVCASGYCVLCAFVFGVVNRLDIDAITFIVCCLVLLLVCVLFDGLCLLCWGVGLIWLWLW